MADHPTSCKVSALVFVILVIGVGLYGGSFQTLHPLNAGLKLNTISQTIDTSQVYTGGRYFLGLGNKFITYPIGLETIEFSSGRDFPADAPALSASTSEGQAVTLEVSFQYRLITGKLADLYKKYERNYKSKFVTLAENALKNTVSRRFTTTDYFERRKAIGEVMHAAVNDALRKEYAVVEYFQLRNVIPPSATDSSILLKLIKQQQVLTASVVQNSSIVRSNTGVIEANAQQQVQITTAKADKTAKIALAEAYATAIGIRLNATAEAYLALKSNLTLSNTQLLRYLFYDYMRTLPAGTKVAVDVDSALVNVN